MPGDEAARGPAGVSVGLVFSRGAGHARSGCHPGSEVVKQGESSPSVSERRARHPRPGHPPTRPRSLTAPPLRASASAGPQGPGGRPDCALPSPSSTERRARPVPRVPPLLRGGSDLLPSLGVGWGRGRAGPHQWRGGQRAARPASGTTAYRDRRAGGAGARRGTNHDAGREDIARLRSTNGQCEAQGRATRRHSNRLDHLPPARPTYAREKRQRKHSSATHSAKPAPIRPRNQWVSDGLIRTFHGRY